jgi:hypothetical protein
VAGVKVIGLGDGDNRPTFTFITAAAASFVIEGDKTYVGNLRFVNDIDSQTQMVNVTLGTAATIENCEFVQGNSSKQALVGIALTDADADRVTIRGCSFITTSAGANAAILIGAAVDRLTIEDCFVYGDFADACIQNPTATSATYLLIRNNNLTNIQTGDHAIQLVSACTGVIANNIVNTNLAAVATATAIDRGACFCVNNYGHDAGGDDSGVLNPAVDS